VWSALKAALRTYVAPLVPGLKTYWVARRTLDAYRPPHFRPITGLIARGPAPLQDFPPQEIAAVNESSKRYFEHGVSREYWLNRPLSDRPTDPSSLWRFGLLASALQLQPGSRVLDFGCGSGWTSTLLARMGADVVGMDIAPEALSLARQVAERDLALCPDGRVQFQLYSGECIEAPDEHFDCALVFDAFHHLPNPRRILAEFHRVLAPHGRFGFAEPGIGHATAESSRAERDRGVLEQDVDIEQFYRSGIEAGFQGLELLIPPLPPEILTLPMQRLRWYLRGFTWLVPSAFVRKEILCGPMGVFRKGPYPVTSLNPRSQRARIVPAKDSVRIGAGDSFSLAVRVTNLGETVWLRTGRHGRGFVRLGAHLLDASGRTIEHDYGRAELPGDVPEDRTVPLEIRLKAPHASGRFRIRLDMVNEGVRWFEQDGSAAGSVELIVT
jgi:SAM-dependent methyltransferase